MSQGDFESDVIGALLLVPERMADVRDLVQIDDFAADRLRRIYAAMLREDDAMRGWTVPTLSDALRVQGVGPGEDKNWPEFLIELAHGVVSTAFLLRDAKAVHDGGMLRRVRQIGASIAPDTEEIRRGTGEVAAYLDELEGRVHGVNTSQFARIEDVGVPAEAKAMQAAIRAGERVAGLNTGLSDLDDLLLGMQPGELVIVGARPSEGKTAFLLQIAQNVARTGQRVAFLSLEVGVAELTERVLANVARIDSRHLRLRRLSAMEMGEFDAAVEDVQGLPMDLLSDVGTTLARFRGIVRRKQRQGPLGAVFLDYVQLMRHPGARDRFQAVGAISTGLKELAKELQVPIVAAAQLNRNAQNTRPNLAQLRESGNLEQDADAVVLLHTESDSKDLLAILAKNRHGPTGDVALTFFRPHFLIASKERSTTEVVFP